MRRSAQRVGRALALGLCVVLASAAHAYIPKGERVARAIAEANSAGGRAQALLINLTLRIGDGDVLARGELLSHPSGLARLELRGANQLVERHLLQGTEHYASRNGQFLQSPREFLPPLFFAQASTATSLRAALSAFGVDGDLVALAPCGERDCFVIGDPDRAPTPSAPAAKAGDEDADREGSEDPWDDGLVTLAPPPSIVWVDRESFRILRLQLSNGVEVELGPPMVQQKVEVPQWVLIQEPGRQPVRFDIERVTAVSAPARAFGHRWLRDGEASDAEEEPLPPPDPRAARP